MTAPMSPEHADTLTTHRFRLMREMDPDDLVDYLLSVHIFNKGHKLEIEKIPDKKNRNRAILDRLTECGDRAFNAFVNGLKETSQSALVNLVLGGAASHTTNIPSAPMAVGSLPAAGNSAAAGSGSTGGGAATSGADAIVHQKLRNVPSEIVAKDILRRNLVYICENLEIKEVAKHLLAHGKLRNATLQSITAKDPGYEQNHALYDYLTKKDKEEFVHFVDSLMATGQESIARKLAEGL